MKTWLEMETRPALRLAPANAECRMQNAEIGSAWMDDGYDYQALVRRWVAKGRIRFAPSGTDALKQKRAQYYRDHRAGESLRSMRKIRAEMKALGLTVDGTARTRPHVPLPADPVAHHAERLRRQREAARRYRAAEKPINHEN